MGLRTRMVFRLAPGEYAEVEGHGLGVGSHETSSEKSIYKVGCWIEAKEGDDVTFTPGKVPVSFQTWQDNEGLKDSITVWQEMIAARVMQESPMPAAAADREQLLRRVTKDLLGTAPTAEEVAAFTADNAPDALAKLTTSLAGAAAAMHFAGELSGGTTKFRVTAAVPKKDEPKQGAKLQPGTEQKLEWGEPVNGLRMALAWPPTLGEPAAGDVPDFFLAVQNVSTAACPALHHGRGAESASPDLRDQRCPSGKDRQLGTERSRCHTRAARGACSCGCSRRTQRIRTRASHGSMLASTVRQSPAMTLLADLEIAKAPAGCMDGQARHPRDACGSWRGGPQEPQGAGAFQSVAGTCAGEWKDPRRLHRAARRQGQGVRPRQHG